MFAYIAQIPGNHMSVRGSISGAEIVSPVPVPISITCFKDISISPQQNTISSLSHHLESEEPDEAYHLAQGSGYDDCDLSR